MQMLAMSLVLGISQLVTAQGGFTHPGLLHTQADLDRMKQMVRQDVEPWKSGFEKLRAHRQSQADWRLRGPFEAVSRGTGENLHNDELAQDGNAAYQNALMWAITGDKAHAEKAIEILNAWSGSLKQITGHDKELAASLYGFKYVNAAEIIRYTYDGWPPAEVKRFEMMLREVFYPVIEDFATFANGNWGTGCIKTMTAIGVFLDDKAIFDRAVDYFHSGSGNGSLTHYIINEQGQCQESGRDQQHTQLGLAHLAEACEIAWNQGLDLYASADNRLRKGFEYTAKYNLGQDVPFSPYRDTTGKYYAQVISTQGRGRLRPIFEMVWNHYEKRKGIPAPYTRQAAEKIRPEGAAFGADHPGFGTLLFTLPDRVESPDGKVAIGFLMQAGGIPAYRIEYLGKSIVLESRLGFEPNFTSGFQIVGTSANTHEEQWTQVYGERQTVPDNYRELNVDLKHESGRLLRLVFRAYNEGAALRYAFPAQAGVQELKFAGERTEFRLPEGTFGYEEHGTEGVYQRSRITDIQPWCERPLTLEYEHGLFASLTEADNQRYPRMLLSPLPGAAGALVSALGGTSSNGTSGQRHDPSVTLSPPFATPWRVFVVGEKPGDLLERNYLLLNLCPPLELKDTSWIKPGKVMRDTTLTTANSKAIIDFAEQAGLQYVHLDWKWYGSEDFNTGDATTVRAPDLDIPEIIRYGREKNVGLIVYVDRRQIKKQRDILFPLYEQWGIKGVKIGFVDVGPQRETAWITETIRKAAEHHLMLNIHDGYRPTGLSRTYPNLMTVEGIRGNEHMPTPEHNCTLPFTRYIAGVGDYTVCYYDRRLKTTHAHQLAMAVVSYSPLQWIFWYDRPSMYAGEPEIEFFRKVPTTWDETKVINGRIGEYATIARRSGRDWFVGTINNSQARRLQVPLTFLTDGKEYEARLYLDDDTVMTRTKVGIETRRVDSKTILNVPLTAGGGQAIWITPAVP